MSLSIDRPKTGLNVDQALEKWSDQATYQTLVEIAGSRDIPSLGHSGRVKDLSRRKEYEALRTKLERAFQHLLIEGTVVASAISEGGKGREVLEQSLWELIEIDYDLHELIGNGRRFQKAEFFDPAAIPLNIHSPPEWLVSTAPQQTRTPLFQPESNYRHILISHTFKLGAKCAKVIELLHQAAMRDDAWQDGKVLLEQAGSAQIKMHDLFKEVDGWQLLIESDGRGQYRLRQR